MSKIRIVGAMVLGLKVVICLSKLPKKTLSSCIWFFFSVSYSLFKISEDPFGGGETRKVSPKVFFFDFFRFDSRTLSIHDIQCCS